MRRVVLLLLVVAALGVALWLAIRAPLEPARGASPVGAPAAPVEVARAPVEDLESGADRTAAETRPAASMPEPALVAAAPAADPTEAELAVFAKVCPPGTIEGIVLRGKVPVAGGQAWLGAESSGGLPWGSPPVWDATVSVRRTDIGADGLFRFEGLAPDSYGVGVRTRDGASRHVYANLFADTPSQRVRIVLGEGGVRGHVHDEHGGAASGWQVAVYNWGNTLADTQVIDGCETDAQGAFEFSGLVGGNYVLSAGPVADRRDPRTRTVFFELRSGEWKSVDVGAAQGGLQWTGRLLQPRGAVLVLSGLTELRIASSSTSERIALSSEGRFSVRLPAGTYQISLFNYYTTRGGIDVVLGEVTLPAHDLEQDVTVPRALVRVRATYGGARPDGKAGLPWLSARLRGAEVNVASALGADGAQYFLAIAPGDYVLSCRPPIQGAPGGRVPVRIGTDDDEVELDVVVGDP